MAMFEMSKYHVLMHAFNSHVFFFAGKTAIEITFQRRLCGRAHEKLLKPEEKFIAMILPSAFWQFLFFSSTKTVQTNRGFEFRAVGSSQSLRVASKGKTRRFVLVLKTQGV